MGEFESNNTDWALEQETEKSRLSSLCTLWLYWTYSIWLVFCLQRNAQFCCDQWVGVKKMNNTLVCLDGCPCCVPWFSSKAFANFPSFPSWGAPAISRLWFSRAGQRQSSETHHVSSKRTYRSATGMMRRLEAIGISLGSATWHSLFSFFCSLSFSVLTSGCRMFCVFRRRWSCSSLSSEAEHHSKNASNIN